MLVPQRTQAPFISPMAGTVDEISHVDDLLRPIIVIRISLGGDPAAMGNSAYVIQHRLREAWMTRVAMVVRKYVEKLRAIAAYCAATKVERTKAKQYAAKRSIHHSVQFKL